MNEENEYVNEGNPNNIDKEEEQIKAIYGEEPKADLFMPEGLMIPPDSKKENVVEGSYNKTIEDEVDVAFKFCFIGSGQAGGRILRKEALPCDKLVQFGVLLTSDVYDTRRQ